MASDASCGDGETTAGGASFEPPVGTPGAARKLSAAGDDDEDAEEGPWRHRVDGRRLRAARSFSAPFHPVVVAPLVAAAAGAKPAAIVWIGRAADVRACDVWR